MANMLDVLKETESMITRKNASAMGKRALAGESPESMPGAENDAKPPAGSTSADAEVASPTMGPASARKTEGAGDDSPTTRGQAVDATQSVKEPAEKPMISDDANAKAAALANDLLADIRGWQTAQKVAAKPEPKKDEPKKEEPAAPAAAAPAAPASKTPEVPPAEPAKAAAPRSEIALTNDVLAKIAAITMSYKDGVDFVSSMLERFAGEKAAQETMAFLETQNARAEKQAALEAGYRDAQAWINQRIFEAGAASKSASARVTPAQLIKLGQQLAAGSMQDAMGAMGAPPAGPAGAPPAGPEGMPPAGPEGAGGGEQEFTIDDVAAALDMMVTNGEIKPEEAQKLLQDIIASAGGGEGGGAAPADAGAAPAGEPPAAEPKGEPKKEEPKKEEPKDAGAKK